MKRPEYVAAVVSAYRNALEGNAVDQNALLEVFSRQGFTDGYWTAARNGSMFGYRSEEDKEQTAKALPAYRALYQKERPRVDVHMAFSARLATPMALAVHDGQGHSVQVQGEPCAKATNNPLTQALLIQRLSKTGGTPYAASQIDVSLENGLFASSAQLNALRQKALFQLSKLRTEGLPPPFCPENLPALPPLSPAGPPRLRLRFSDIGQGAEEVDLTDIEYVILPVDTLLSYPERWQPLAPKVMAELPALVFPLQEQALAQHLLKLWQLGVRHVLSGSLGQLQLARQTAPFCLHGDAFLNIYNAQAAAAYHDFGLSDLTLSFENTLRQAEQTPSLCPKGLIAYGHLPLMTVRSCPGRGLQGCEGCTGAFALKDRKGLSFPVVCQHRAYAQVYNPIPLYLAPDPPPRVDFCTLYFTKESPALCKQVLSCYRQGLPLPFPTTHGLYRRKLL